jgi:hypothetical protein
MSAPFVGNKGCILILEMIKYYQLSLLLYINRKITEWLAGDIIRDLEEV